MIEINLLPSEMRKRKLELPEIPLIPVGVGILCVFVIGSLILGLVVHRKNSQLKILRREWEQKLPLKKEADGLKAEIERLRRKKALLENLSKRRFLWSAKLNSLSDLIPMGIWLTELSLDEMGETKFLTLEGIAMPFKGQEMVALVTGFMETLKNDKTFFSGLEEIELGPIERIKVEEAETEVMRFSLICRLEKERE